MKKKKITKYIVAALLLIALLLILTPLFWCISLSFDRRALTNLPAFSLIPHEPVSYTHLDVYKRQVPLLPMLLFVNPEILLDTGPMLEYVFRLIVLV